MINTVARECWVATGILLGTNKKHRPVIKEYVVLLVDLMNSSTERKLMTVTLK